MQLRSAAAGLGATSHRHHRPSSAAVAVARRQSRPSLRRAPTTTVVTVAALDAADASTTASALPAVGAAVVAVLGLGGYRAALYSTLEYAKAAALARFVPKGAATPNSRGAKVVLLGASTRDIYYLPKDTLSAVAIGSDVNVGLFDQAGVSAGVPTTGKKVAPSAPWGGPEGFAAAGSLDAVVALGSALGKLTAQERAQCLREAVKALRPGRPLVMLQALSEGGSPLRGVVGPGGGSGAIPASELEKALEEAGFAYVEWGVELQGADPHALGVAVTPSSQDGGEEASASGGKRRRREAAAAEKKGFLELLMLLSSL